LDLNIFQNIFHIRLRVTQKLLTHFLPDFNMF